MKIDLEKQHHQDNLKVEFYYQFMSLVAIFDCKFRLLCEYRVKGSRFDMIVYDNALNLIGIIEFRRMNTERPPKTHGNKHLKYSQLGVPIYYISKYSEIPDLINKFFNPE